MIGLGFWQAGGRSWRSAGLSWVDGVVRAAVESGIIFFDTAEIYGWGRSEEALGAALSRHARGYDVVVASKLGGFRVGWWLVRKGLQGVNRRLGRVVDLIQAHWPPPVWVPLCSVVRALERAVAEGLAHYYGLSNYPERLVERALECASRIEPVSDQVQYSLAYRSPEIGLKPLLDDKGLGLIAWSPLAKGALAGAAGARDPAQARDPVFREAARDRALQEALSRVAARTGMTRAQVALAWLVSKGAIPIPGTRRPGRVAEYASAAGGLPGWAVRELDEASARYLERWGRSYRALQWLRLVPCGLQYLAIRLSGGV